MQRRDILRGGIPIGVGLLSGCPSIGQSSVSPTPQNEGSTQDTPPSTETATEQSDQSVSLDGDAKTGVVGTEWSTAGRSGYRSYSTPDPGPEPPLETRWSVEAPPDSRTLVVDDGVLFGDWSYKAVTPDNGGVAWSKTSDRIDGSWCYDGLLHLYANSKILQFDIESGERKTEISGLPASPDELIPFGELVAILKDGISVYDVRTGENRWTLSREDVEVIDGIAHPEGLVSTEISKSDGGTPVTGSQSIRVYDPSTGEVKRDFDGPLLKRLATDGKWLYGMPSDAVAGRVVGSAKTDCVSLEQETKLSSMDGYDRRAVDGGRIFVARSSSVNEGSGVYCFDGASGTRQWGKQVGLAETNIISAANRLYVGTGEKILVLDKETGEQLTSIEVSKPIFRLCVSGTSLFATTYGDPNQGLLIR